MSEIGYDDGDIVIDFGAGACDFGRFLYGVARCVPVYVPIDGAIQGVDLNNITGIGYPYEFAVAIEVLEHLHNPAHVVEMLRANATKGVVVTVPNIDVVGLDEFHKMDATHITPIYRDDFVRWGATAIRTANCFGKDDDTLIATFDMRPSTGGDDDVNE